MGGWEGALLSARLWFTGFHFFHIVEVEVILMVRAPGKRDCGQGTHDSNDAGAGFIETFCHLNSDTWGTSSVSLHLQVISWGSSRWRCA